MKYLRSNSLLGTAVELNMLHLVEDLLVREPQRLADRNLGQESMLMISVRTSKDIEMVELLLKHGADAQAVDGIGHGVLWGLHDEELISILERAIVERASVERAIDQSVDGIARPFQSTISYPLRVGRSTEPTTSQLTDVQRDSETTTTSLTSHVTGNRPTKHGLWRRLVTSVRK